MSRNYKFISKVAVVATTGLISFSLASDAVQVQYLKCNLYKVRLPNPSTTLPRKGTNIEIDRSEDIDSLCNIIPSQINAGWVLMGNPPGYGKTYLISKWASLRDENYAAGRYGTCGPVLRVDFAAARNADHAQRLLLDAFTPHMLNPYFYFFFLGSHQPDLSPEEKLHIVRAACLELAECGTPVILVMDSVSTLVNAANLSSTDGQAMAGFIRSLFDLNEVLVAVPVASSATTVVNLQKSNPHVFFRTTPYHPPFVSDPVKLQMFLKNLLENSGVPYTQEDIVDASQYFGGSLVTYIELVNRAKQNKSLRKALNLSSEQHFNNVAKIIFFDNSDSVTAEQRALGLRCFDMLKLAAKEKKTAKELAALRVYTDPAVQHLLKTRDPTLPLVGISPESSGLVLSWPGTAEAVRLLESRAQELRAQANSRVNKNKNS